MRRRERTCRLCGTPNDTTEHHMIPQAQATIISKAHVGAFARIDVRDKRNIVILCRHHHDAIDTYRILRALLREHLTEVELLHIRNVAGPEWLDEHYPPTNGRHHNGQS